MDPLSEAMRRQGDDVAVSQVTNHVTSPDWLLKAQNLSQKLNESASLQGRTKEEKYALDFDVSMSTVDWNCFLRGEGIYIDI